LGECREHTGIPFETSSSQVAAMKRVARPASCYVASFFQLLSSARYVFVESCGISVYDCTRSTWARHEARSYGKGGELAWRSIAARAVIIAETRKQIPSARLMIEARRGQLRLTRLSHGLALSIEMAPNPSRPVDRRTSWHPAQGKSSTLPCLEEG
jgi:hypothetical protein